MKVVVLAGGLSPERNVSLSSGTLIANALIENGHDVMLVDLYQDVKTQGLDKGYVTAASNYRFEYEIPKEEPDLKQLKSSSLKAEQLIGSGVIQICQTADKVFLALHGSIGENGSLQAVLDCYGISYTGTGYIGSLLAMDKDLSKQIIRYNHISTPDWMKVRLKNYPLSMFESVAYPCVVKPCGCGSSVGISMVDSKDQLLGALDHAKLYEEEVIIEKKIIGREFSVGILGGKTLPPIEIIPSDGFYDYEHKYQAGKTEELCPVNISEELDELLRESALKVHQVLRLGYYSRIDFIINAEGIAYCLEANTLPGMTPESLLPKEAKAVGISFQELCDKILLEK